MGESYLKPPFGSIGYFGQTKDRLERRQALEGTYKIVLMQGDFVRDEFAVRLSE